MNNTDKISPCNQINFLKGEIAKLSFKSKEGHVASAYSIMDLLWVLFKDVLKVDLDHRSLERFVLSKGHASLALYAMLLDAKIISCAEFQSFCEYDSKLGGHPDSNKLPHVSASTGSLGHGLAMSVGMAMASKIQKNDNRVFCLLGDGECNEGSVWEAVLLAAEHKLNNLCCIVDMNHSGDRAIHLGQLNEKFESFGCKVVVIDGHDHSQILQAYQSHHDTKPLVVIAETIKGKGVGVMENAPAWHHRSPTEDELVLILGDLSLL